MTAQHYEYLTSENKDGTKTVHLASFEVWPNVTTLCGRKGDGMLIGDETPSGVAATCNRCRRIIGLAPVDKEEYV
jgi:hypothetical protein